MQVQELNKPIEILLVEDNLADVVLMKQLLRRSRFPVQVGVVRDGEKVFEYLRRSGSFQGTQRPDLILLDLNLPHKSGFEVLAEIKRSHHLRTIPILVLTDSNTDEDRWRAYHSRVDSYLLKPGSLSQFEALLRYLEKYWFKELRPEIP